MGIGEGCLPDLSRSDRAPRESRHAFAAVCTLIFSASAALTISWSARMQEMGEIRMPGGWTLSAMWMRMPGQGRSDVALSFIGMWAAMMIAMMLPSLAPELLRYRTRMREHGEMRGDLLTAQVGAAYFLVLSVAGALIFPIGASIASEMMRNPALARTVPVSTGVVMVFAGALQFTKWKAHHLACWSDGSWCAQMETADSGTAWRQGVRLAIHCTRCCWPFMAILLAAGTMNLRAMTLATMAITLERLVPGEARIVRGVGAATMGTGLLLLARAAMLA
jgi:predicted metal-binding membrane protein